MAKNLGQSTERWVEVMLTQYRAQRVADIRKVDPPTRVVRQGAKVRVVLMQNPFLDFVGTWTERGGRAIFFELKRTEDDSLRIDRTGGVTPAQWRALQSWEAAGAVSFVLWEHRDRFAVITPALIKATLAETSRVSVPWSHAIHVPRSNDFLRTVEALTF